MDQDTGIALIVFFSDVIVPTVIMLTLMVYVAYYIKRYYHDLARDAKQDTWLDEPPFGPVIKDPYLPKLKKSVKKRKRA